MSKKHNKAIFLCGLPIMVASIGIFDDSPNIIETAHNDFAILIKRSACMQQNIPFFTRIYDNDIHMSKSFFEIRYNGITLLQINTSSTPWVVTFNNKISANVCEELFVKIAIPYYYYTQSTGLPLHATTVRYGADLICIMGESYSGKSTLAYYLLLDNRFSLLSDDVTAIRVSSNTDKMVSAYSGSNQLKIRKETASFFSTDTLLYTFPHDVDTTNNQIKCIFFIKPCDKEHPPVLRLCSKIESQCLLLKNLYASYLYKLDTNIIQTVSIICDKVKIYELDYFKDFSQLKYMKNILITQVEHK